MTAQKHILLVDKNIPQDQNPEGEMITNLTSQIESLKIFQIGESEKGEIMIGSLDDDSGDPIFRISQHSSIFNTIKDAVENIPAYLVVVFCDNSKEGAMDKLKNNMDLRSSMTWFGGDIPIIEKFERGG